MTSQRFALDGRVAVVTGAAGLLGTRHCLALAETGANVVAVDLKGQDCTELALHLRAAHGREAYGHACDITDVSSVARLREAVLHWFGHVDVLVNNAAVDDKVERSNPGEVLSFEKYPLELWERALRVNVTGTFLCCQSLGAEMAAQGRGSIINIASTYGVVAPDQSLYRNADGTQTFFKSAAYPATKGAVLALTRFLGAYWGRAGVRVNALSPGGVENGQDPEFVARYSERTPLGRMAHASDYAGALIFLASDASDYVTGANLIVDGGWTAW
jgi:NAD(P)-dependent dehydrogenase (short-subunit alcohol dehydrogenase family)